MNSIVILSIIWVFIHILLLFWGEKYENWEKKFGTERFLLKLTVLETCPTFGLKNVFSLFLAKLC